MNHEILRRLPSIDELMSSPEVAHLVQEHDRGVVVDAARSVIQSLRQEILNGGDSRDISVEEIGSRIVEHIRRKFAPSMRKAVNASGVILHTGLGRAMMPPAAAEAVHQAIIGYCTLAADLDHGQRMSRDVHYSDLLCELTGAEAATVVNNNAAATLLVLNTLAEGKEVIVSRGQLVEIGGSFRMPEVMAASGAILREVGTTNKTHLRDYAAAINENTGAILKVHQSNYKIVGFTEEPSIHEITELAREHDLPVIDDLGSGALVDLTDFGIEQEPMIQDSIEAGAEVVCFSGDKLIGGPQSGIIVGKAEAIKRIKKNPLARALRIGKMEVAALEATLKVFLDRDKLTSHHPTYRMLSLTPAELEKRARSVMRKVRSDRAEIRIVDGHSQVGSGSSPAEILPSRLLSVKPKSISAGSLARKLRYYDMPIFARIHDDSVLFDFRTIQPDEDRIVAEALTAILLEDNRAG